MSNMIYNFNDFILEQVEQTEYIDFKKTNLLDDFNYLNDLMFNNEVRPVELKWFKSKNKVGLASFKDGDVISISNFYKMTKKQYLSILAHEMIHMYIHHYNLNDSGDHGWRFMKIMNRINDNHPEFELKPSEDAAFYSVDNNIKKPIGVVLFVYDGGENIDTDYNAIFVNSKVINNVDMVSDFIERMKTYNEKSPYGVFRKNETVTIEFYKCDNPDLSKFKLKRNLSSGLEFYGINEGDLRKIKEGELINTIKLK